VLQSPKLNTLPVFFTGVPEERNLFRRYAAIMGRSWNRSLTVLYDTRSYEAGLSGAHKLVDLNERFKSRLGKRRYELYLIRIALLELTCLDRLDWLPEYLSIWAAWRLRPLAVPYHISRRQNPRIWPFVVKETDRDLLVHFLYLTRARKEVIERKIGTHFKTHARQEDLTDAQLRERLARLRA
jgi:hypothetical protein